MRFSRSASCHVHNKRFHTFQTVNCAEHKSARFNLHACITTHVFQTHVSRVNACYLKIVLLFKIIV